MNNITYIRLPITSLELCTWHNLHTLPYVFSLFWARAASRKIPKSIPPLSHTPPKTQGPRWRSCINTTPGTTTSLSWHQSGVGRIRNDCIRVPLVITFSVWTTLGVWTPLGGERFDPRFATGGVTAAVASSPAWRMPQPSEVSPVFDAEVPVPVHATITCYFIYSLVNAHKPSSSWSVSTYIDGKGVSLTFVMYRLIANILTAYFELVETDPKQPTIR